VVDSQGTLQRCAGCLKLAELLQDMAQVVNVCCDVGVVEAKG
jgi:hypothetical protein